MTCPRLNHVARILCGDVHGHNAIMCPGPAHSSRDRSLVVFINPNAPDGFRVHSHAADDWRICREYVKSKLGSIRMTLGRGGYRPNSLYPNQSERAAIAMRTTGALAIFAEAKSINGTPVMRYLARRGIELARLPTNLHDVLRWHPSCPWE